MSKKLILVVEDNESIVFNIKLSLEMNSFEVETALNGSEAIKILEKNPRLPDLILSDIMMPVMDGYELFKIVSNNIRWKSIPFIFISAKSMPNEIQYGLDLGAFGYLSKPINEKELIALLNKALD